MLLQGKHRNSSEYSQTMTTQLARISQLSAADPQMVFRQLMHHFTKDRLGHCYQSLSGRAASGIDGVTKKDYGRNLQENLDDLWKRLKAMAYRPCPARQVMIPKEGKKGATRPLGIGNFEDKIVHKGIQNLLEAIYEPLFLDCSYGFRPKRGCHDAIRDLNDYLYRQPVKVVLDLDLSNYFGTIDHEILMDMVSRRIQDQRFLRYLRRILKAGILSDGELRISEEGVPQGSVCSPVLANIFAHHVLDEWFEVTVKHHCYGKVALFRYADDVVICCETSRDAERIQTAIAKRLEKYKLKLNKDKTRSIQFDRQDRLGSGAFDFLGFTFYLGLTKRGAVIPKLKTSGKRVRGKLKRVNEWCRRYRNQESMLSLWMKFGDKLRGHIQYYGVSFNGPAVHYFVRQSCFKFLRWMNRRSQRKSMSYDEFKQFMQAVKLPSIRICHRLF